jgi:hypothetical protein
MLVTAAYEELSSTNAIDFGSGPVGICWYVGDRELLERRREALWDDTGLLYAGYLPDGSQTRIRYFPRAEIAPRPEGHPPWEPLTEMPEYPLPPGFAIHHLPSSMVVKPDDVLAVWARYGVVDAEEALRRVHEVSHVCTAPDGEVVGLNSMYLQRNRQLGMDLWYYRVFVAAPYRRTHVAAALGVATYWWGQEVAASGEPLRGHGSASEQSNPELQRLDPRGERDFGSYFIGESPPGTFVRITYSQGAEVPPPPPAL